MKKINIILLFLALVGFTNMANANDERVVRCTILSSYFSDIQNIKNLSDATKAKIDGSSKSMMKDNKCDTLMDMIKLQTETIRGEISNEMSRVLK